MNLPAVIGVVFVFLLGVIIWVITSTGGDDQIATDPSTPSTTTNAPSTTSTSSTVPADTTPVPLPVLTTVAATDPTTTPATVPPTPAPAPPTAPPAPPTPTQPPAPTTTAAPAPTTTTTPAPTTPPTSSPDSEPGAVPGDLGIDDYPMQAPACDESFITIIASAVGEQATAGGIEAVLSDYDGSNYLRTDQTCPSLNPSVDGEPIYVVYFGPFPFAADACAARAEGTDGAYARQLSEDLPPDHTVNCPPLDDDEDEDE
ncbi:MAG: hypothetical protein CL424_15910 [Acidimicrobiaceae bacterium]|nr:hypothetical protein [Acidimicrobiaceae bacterium]